MFWRATSVTKNETGDHIKGNLGGEGTILENVGR